MERSQSMSSTSLIGRLALKMETMRLQAQQKHSIREDARRKKKAKREQKKACRLNGRTQFSKLFNALPAEIQSMVIAEVMREEQHVNFNLLRVSRRHLDLPFLSSKTFKAEAKLQHARVNTLFLPRYHWFPLKLGPTIRHLCLPLEIKVEGGPSMTCHLLSGTEERDLKSIPRLFPQLESFTCDVSNTGSVVPRAVYLMAPGVLSVYQVPVGMMVERIGKVGGILALMRDLEFPVWKKNLKFSKRLIFTQQKHTVYRAGEVVTMADQGESGQELTKPYAKWLQSIMDHPRTEIVLKNAPLTVASA